MKYKYIYNKHSHIFVKTNDIMKLISTSYIEYPYSTPNSLIQFLE